MRTQSHMRQHEPQRRGLCDLCATLPAGLTGIEIGSFAGESAAIFMASGKFTQLYCVDPWPDRHEWTCQAESRFDAAHSSDPRVVKCKGCLADFRRTLPDADFVYIDARHDRVSVLRDIGQAMLLLKPGGILAGHDHHADHPGVVAAVAAFFGESIEVFADSSWRAL